MADLVQKRVDHGDGIMTLGDLRKALSPHITRYRFGSQRSVGRHGPAGHSEPVRTETTLPPRNPDGLL